MIEFLTPTSLLVEGRGYDALGLMDTMVDRLFHYICGKEVHSV